MSLYTSPPSPDESRDLTKRSIGRAEEMASDVLRVTKQAEGHRHCLLWLTGALVRGYMV